MLFGNHQLISTSQKTDILASSPKYFSGCIRSMDQHEVVVKVRERKGTFPTLCVCLVSTSCSPFVFSYRQVH